MANLPLECEVEYHPNFLSGEERHHLFDYLSGIEDLKETVIKDVNGKEYRLATGLYHFADEDLLGFDHLPEVLGPRRSWTLFLTGIKDRVEKLTERRFHVGTCVYYPNGEVGICFHTDLRAFGSVEVIASLSIGAERSFAFRRNGKPDEQFHLTLGDGSLLVMGAGCQDLYEHSLLVDTSVRQPRFNLSFRMFGDP